MRGNGSDPLRRALDALVEQNETSDFIGDDPIQFARRYSLPQDAEVAALLASTLAWGNRRAILASCERLLGGLMENRPYDYVMQGDWEAAAPALAGQNIHRTFFGRDLVYLCRGLRAHYRRHSSLEALFAQGDTVWQGIAAFRAAMAAANDGATSKHLSNPSTGSRGGNGSACKRLQMMLRWLCRQNSAVDLGLWSSIDPARLMMPLDLHVARNARRLGLLARRQNDRRAVEELTASLARFAPHDPVRYDFALFLADEL